MLERSILANTLLALAITATTWALWSLGESRVDLYTSLYALEYTIIKALMRPKRVAVDVPWLILLTLFTVAVAYRIAGVLGWLG